MKSFKSLISVFFLMALACTAQAGLKFQRHVPELAWLAEEAITPDEKMEAIIFAPKGLSCRLPSKAGYCRVRLYWMTTRDKPASLWRTNGDLIYKIAYAYDGVIDAYVRFGQELVYDLKESNTYASRVLDSVTVTAEWDDSWATLEPEPGAGEGGYPGEEDEIPLTEEEASKPVENDDASTPGTGGSGGTDGNGDDIELDESGYPVIDKNTKGGIIVASDKGQCQIYYGEDSCSIVLRWATSQITTASVWQRKSSGLMEIASGMPSGMAVGKAYDFPVVYELREGLSSGGKLLSAVMTKGYRVNPEGSLSLPDGVQCAVLNETDFCDLRVKYQTNDIGRLWVREKSFSSATKFGQALVSVGTQGARVDLRAGSSPTGAILDRIDLRAVKAPDTGTLAPVGGVCMIPYYESTCEQNMVFSTSGEHATVWDESGNLLASGKEGNFKINATEPGLSYTLRKGDEPNGLLLKTYILKGNKQKYTGTFETDETTCTFNYQRGSCSLTVSYTATDKSSVWRAYDRLLSSTSEKIGTATVELLNYDGLAETNNRFDLRFDGGMQARYSNPLLNTQFLLGVRPVHTGKMTGNASCNMLYSRNDCYITLTSISTSPLVSIWRDGEPDAKKAKLWEGAPGAKINVLVHSGTENFSLREGNNRSNDVLQTLTLKAQRPSYQQQITADRTECTPYEFSASCTFLISTSGNATATLYYRNVNSSSWTTWQTTSSYKLSNLALPIATQTQDITYEIEARLGTSTSGEVMDRIQVTAKARTEQRPVAYLGDAPTDHMCVTYPGSTYCPASFDVRLDTEANNVRLCIFRQSNNTYVYSANTSTKSKSINLTFLQGGNYQLIGYEGNTACGTTAGERFRIDLPDIKVTAPQDVAAEFVSEDYSCNVRYQGFGYCHTSSYGKLNNYEAGHSSYPQVYAQRPNGANRTSITTLNSAEDFSLGSLYIAEGEVDVLYELRVASNGQVSANDPVIDTVIVNHGWSKNVAYVYPARTPTGSYASTSYVASHQVPYYYARSYANSTYEAPSACLLNINQTTCPWHFWLRVSTGSSYASLYIRDQYITSTTGTVHGNTVMTEGTHRIEVREGAEPGARQNNLLDGYDFVVTRPEYWGTISIQDPLPTVSYYGYNVPTSFTIKSNTSAYLFREDTKALICTISPWYTALEQAATCSQNLTAGTYTLTLKSRSDYADSDAVVFDQKTFTTEHRVNEGSFSQDSYAPQFFSTCQVAYHANDCGIWFDYRVTGGTSSLKAGSMCIMTHAGSVIKGIELTGGGTTYGHVQQRVPRGATKLIMVDGLNCPENIEETEIPIFQVAEISTTDTYPTGTIRATGVTIAEDSANDQFICTRRFFGETCEYTMHSRSYPTKATYSDYYTFSSMYKNQAFYTYSSSTPQSVSIAQTLPHGADVATYETVVCKTGSSSSAANCPRTDETVMDKTTVRIHLPDYTGEITTPNGDFCEGQYRQTTCNMQIKATSDSAKITLYRDGVQIKQVTEGLIDEPFVLPLKPNGLKTKLTLYDGDVNLGRVLHEVEVYAKEFDPAEFEFTNQKSGSTDDLAYIACSNSNIIEGQTSKTCQLDIAYKSDASKKDVTAASQMAFSGSNQSVVVQGNGISPATITETNTSPVSNYAWYSDNHYTFSQGSVVSKRQGTQFVQDRLNVKTGNTAVGSNYLGGYSGITLNTSGYFRKNYQTSSTTRYLNYTSSCPATNGSKKLYSTYNSSYCRDCYGVNEAYEWHIDHYHYRTVYYDYRNTCYYYSTEEGTRNFFTVKGGVQIDDITLSAPDSCFTDSMDNNYSCGRVTYNTYYKSIANGLNTFSINTSSTYGTRKLFYRVRSLTEDNKSRLVDPTISFGTTTRPLELDGSWHYISFNGAAAPNTMVSASLYSEGLSKTIYIDIFAETEPN
ncbi:hypothetical protein P5704_028415 (plasmid) [Pseudomonas sp. FeN3W]|nr:hypothetical protein P5704_028415 [Pseudomonas sp. FeN3W]